MKLTAIDLFAGIGGIRMGFEQAFGDDIEFVFASEIDKFACQTYETNFCEYPMGDIRTIKVDDIPDHDILCAGFPCQPFSKAGRKLGFEDTRSTLFYEIVRIIRGKQPKAFFLENVKNLSTHQKRKTIRTIMAILENELGYDVHYKIINATEMGIPQNRERIYIVGFKKKTYFNFPNPSSEKKVLADILETKVDPKHYISQRYLDSLKAHRKRHEAKGHGFGYCVLDRDGVSNTLVKGGMGHERNLVYDCINSEMKNSDHLRKMSVREWARLQGFPDTFIFPVSDTQAYRQIANSVPVPVIKAIATSIKGVL